MNLCEGRVGRQESAAMVWTACVIAVVFAVNTQESFSGGNASYAATLFAAPLALGLFCLTAAAMRARGCDTLQTLYRYAFGPAFGFIVSLLTIGMLTVMAAIPLAGTLAILCRYIFSDVKAGQIALYFLPVVATLTLMGLETISRTTRLFILVIFLSFLLLILIAIPAYEGFRLYPLLGGSAERLGRQAICATAGFLPALLALLICGRGVQGIQNASRSAAIAVCAAAALAGLIQFCLGMAFSHETLASIHAPIFRLTAAVRTGSAYLRTDKLLLFFWLIAAMLAAAFLSYSAALMYTRSSGMRDVRPAAAVFGIVACALSLMMETGGKWALQVAVFLQKWAWALLAAPPLLAAGTAMLRGRKRT